MSEDEKDRGGDDGKDELSDRGGQEVTVFIICSSFLTTLKNDKRVQAIPECSLSSMQRRTAAFSYLHANGGSHLNSFILSNTVHLFLSCSDCVGRGEGIKVVVVGVPHHSQPPTPTTLNEEETWIIHIEHLWMVSRPLHVQNIHDEDDCSG